MYQATNIYAISAVAVVGGALFGFDISSMSAIISTEHYLCYFNDGPYYFGDVAPDNPKGKCSGPTPAKQGGITAAMPGGSWVGAIASGFLSDILGRKKSIQVGAVIWVIGSIITCATTGIGMLIAGRVINGFAVGICSAQVPVYISELAPPSKRGRLVGTQQWAITWGILIMFYVSYGCSFIGGPTDPTAFRIPWAVQMIPGIFLAVALLFMPESPRWLAKRERWDEAWNIIAAVHAKGDATHPWVRAEMQQIKEVVDFERRNADVSFLELFKPDMIFRTHIGVFTQIWSQLTGMNVMMYYITYVFAMAGMKGNNLLVSSSIQFIINVAMTVPALIWLDTWGRRWAFIVGGSLMCIFMFATGAIMANFGHHVPEGIEGVKAASWSVNSGAPAKAIIACSYLFVASFAPTWGPASWVYPPELYPLRVRGKAVALSTSANWIFNFALSYFVPPAFEAIQWRTYMIFGTFCLVMTLHVFLCFPETSGKTLEDVQEMFKSGTPAWRTGVRRDIVAKEHGNFEPPEAKPDEKQRNSEEELRQALQRTAVVQGIGIEEIRIEDVGDERRLRN